VGAINKGDLARGWREINPVRLPSGTSLWGGRTHARPCRCDRGAPGALLSSFKCSTARTGIARAAGAPLAAIRVVASDAITLP